MPIATPAARAVALANAILADCSAESAVRAAELPSYKGRLFLLAVGKAAGPMARGFVESHGWPSRSLVVTSPGSPPGPCGMEVLHAGHPYPDPVSEEAARRCLEIAAEAGEGDLVVVLLSGGASALICAPLPELGLERARALMDLMLRSGTDIACINTVRKHLSLIKGGRLAVAAHPARVCTLAVSDVVGDAADVIGSGPTVQDHSTVAGARAVAVATGMPAPLPFVDSPDLGALGVRAEFRLLLRPEDLLRAAERVLAAKGYAVIPLGGDLTGEARVIAASHARIAHAVRDLDRPVALLSGGELTVRVVGHGRGGPNQEYALALASGLAGVPGAFGFAIDTDGRDGNSGAAGGAVDDRTSARLAAAGLDPDQALARNDSAAALRAVDGLVEMAPTGNNLNDLRVILLDRP